MAFATANLPVRVGVFVTYVAMIVVNTLANTRPINGRQTGGVSDAYGNLVTPAAVSFSIWGLIYVLLGLHVLYQWGLFHKAEHTHSGLLTKVAVLFSGSSVANAAWIFAWHYDVIGLSTLLMAIILILLILILRTLQGVTLSKREALFVQLPFSVYLGWITIATVLNVTVWLVSIRWDGFGLSEGVWAVVIIIVAAVIGTSTTLRNRDVAYGLVLLWAFAGILIKHMSAAGFNGQYPVVIGTIVVCLVVFVGAVATVIFRRRQTGGVTV